MILKPAHPFRKGLFVFLSFRDKVNQIDSILLYFIFNSFPRFYLRSVHVSIDKFIIVFVITDSVKHKSFSWSNSNVDFLLANESFLDKIISKLEYYCHNNSSHHLSNLIIQEGLSFEINSYKLNSTSFLKLNCLHFINIPHWTF